MNENELTIVQKFYQSVAKDLDTFPEGNSVSSEYDDNLPKASVTSLVYECLRKTYYSMTLRLRTDDIGGTIRTWVGKKLHETKVLGEDAIEELRLVYNGVVGRIDEYKDGVLLEKKTTRSLPREPRLYHIRQIEYYTILLEKHGYPVKQAFILYIDVDSGAAVAFDVTKQMRPRSIVEHELVTKADKIREALKYKILPPPIFKTWPNSQSLICKYCPYFSLCIRDFDPATDSLVKNVELDFDEEVE